MTKLSFAKQFFYSSLIIFSNPLYAQLNKISMSIEVGMTRNSINFLSGDPYSVTLKTHDNFNYAVFPLSGYYTQIGLKRKIIKQLFADISIGYSRLGYEGHHLDSFYTVKTSPIGDALFVRDESWTQYGIHSLFVSPSFSYSLNDKIFFRGGFLFQFPFVTEEKLTQVKLHELKNLSESNFISNKTTQRFNDLFLGWETSISFQLYHKVYLVVGYKHLFSNNMSQPYYDEKVRAPHFRQALSIGSQILINKIKK